MNHMQRLWKLLGHDVHVSEALMSHDVCVYIVDDDWNTIIFSEAGTFDMRSQRHERKFGHTHIEMAKIYMAMHKFELREELL